jgi:glucose/arabinose dehydrogenase
MKKIHVGEFWSCIRPLRTLSVLILTLSFVTTTVAPTFAQIKLQRIVQGLTAPVLALELPLAPRTLLVVEQQGIVRIVKRGKILPQLFLDFSKKVSKGSEQGLLGMAFDPNFRKNGLVYVSYTRRDGTSVLSSLRVGSRNPERVLARSEVVRLTIPQPFENHNGGHILFGPDGYLYLGMGDGGSGGDPQNNAQTLSNLLGKIVRIDLSVPKGYRIPPDNPFVSVQGVRPEIYIYGVRNPWRFSFDAVSRRLFIGDVGQNEEEEISIGEKGDNLGWRLKEGSRCYLPAVNCDQGGLRDPIVTYSHREGQSITGGFVYRGKLVPSLTGKYLFADFSSGVIFTATEQNDGSWVRGPLLESGKSISSFAQRSSGELLIIDYSGAIFQLK